ncbi:MAG: glycosyltransferase [Candidatus Marinimicrobia bacterium]|nr:glycosyltransferase [Candidatus Neomarinimicrobiota bacterium]
MKILYISPENTVGTLSLWKKAHETNGHYCRTVTFFRSPKNFSEDICLELPFDFTQPRLSNLRHQFFKIYRGKLGYMKEKEGCPPRWEPEGFIYSVFTSIKERLWKPIIENAITKYNLFDFDVIHFESGMDFFKDERFALEAHKKGCKIICHYHGEDLRTRGVMPNLDKMSVLNLTNEPDLLHKHSDIHYLFLPYDTNQFTVKNSLNEQIRVAHAPTNRYYKNSQVIIDICEQMEREELINFDLIENLSHKEALARKQKADIFIDQIGDLGGWGYGMNSVESLSMGICTLNTIQEGMIDLLGDHPFVNVNANNLEISLYDLVNNRERIHSFGNKGKQWVSEKHNYKSVTKSLYEYYHTIGLKV